MAELIKSEEPRNLNNCLYSLKELAWKARNFESNNLLQCLIDKGVNFDYVPRTLKIQFLLALYSNICAHVVGPVQDGTYWVQTLRKLELLGFEAAAQEVVNPKVPSTDSYSDILRAEMQKVKFAELDARGKLIFQAREREMIALVYSLADCLTFAHLLSHHDKIKHKLGSVPLQILQMDVLKY